MQNIIQIQQDLFYIGGSDPKAILFENHIPAPHGVSYNSYLLTDEKTVLFDTVDLSVAEQFFENLAEALGGRGLDYLVIHHMEPDHSASFLRLLERYPGVMIVTNQKVATMLGNFFSFAGENVHLVKDGDTMSVGMRTLRFVFAPMVHWPEVMMTYVVEDGILFSADAFGTFGALSGSIYADEVKFEEECLDDARKYYFNIVGKFGVQVQSALKKLNGAEMRLVCPLHGPIWRENFAWYLQKYDVWSRYEPEETGVAVFCGSIYGHTKEGAQILASELAKEGIFVKVYDASTTHVCDLLAEAFRFSHSVFASSTHNNGIFLPMEQLIHDLKAHYFRNRKYALIENGSWAPQAGALMEAELSALKYMTKLGDTVRILSSVKGETHKALIALADVIAEDIKATFENNQ